MTTKRCIFDVHAQAMCSPQRRKLHPGVCGNCGHNPEKCPDCGKMMRAIRTEPGWWVCDSCDRAHWLGEDQVIVRHLGGQYLVYGTPWHTNPELCSPGGVPLHKLFFLDRTADHGVQPLGPRAGIERLLQQSFIPYYKDFSRL